jgi:hypothetical protein
MKRSLDEAQRAFGCLRIEKYTGCLFAGLRGFGQV